MCSTNFSKPSLTSNNRPTVGSLQKWADEVGDQSYTWDNFLPYYKKSCNYTPPNQTLYTNATNRQDPSSFDPAGGPLTVSFSNFVDPFGTWAQKGFEAVGMKAINGLNSGSLIGSAYATLTIDPRNAYRSSSESSFLQAALQNGTSPTVYKNSFAQRILFSSNKTAIGVMVTTAGPYGIPEVNYTLSARKEVIVSGGVFQSPQLLMVSGIGPKAILSQFGIPVLKDLPGVGQNMWDHPLFGTDYRVNVNTASAPLNNATLAAAAVKLFQENATGPLSIFGAGIYGFENLPQPYRSHLTNASLSALTANFPSDWPELEWLPVSAYSGYAEDKQTADPRDGSNYATINTAIVSPLSRGNVSLQSASMLDPPLINPNWLTNPTDIELAIQSVHRQREIWAYLTSQGLTNGVEAFPGANVTSDADILSYIQKSVLQVYHAAATCKMGARNDSMAVVDSQARVYGTQNLRVVDASSFPFLPPGHPQSTVYALAEKIAANILGNDTPGPGYKMGPDYSTILGPQINTVTSNKSNGASAARLCEDGTITLVLSVLGATLYSLV